MNNRSGKFIEEFVKTFKESLLKFMEFRFGEGLEVGVESEVVEIDDGIRFKVNLSCDIEYGDFYFFESSKVEGDDLGEDIPVGQEFTDYLRSQGYITGPEVMARARQETVLS